MTLIEKAQHFRNLHVAGNPLILYNIWDAGSAVAVARAGAKAIATSSWSVAAAQGYLDGEQLPLEVALAVVKQIVVTLMCRSPSILKVVTQLIQKRSVIM